MRWVDRWTGKHGGVLEFIELAFNLDRRRARMLLRRLERDHTASAQTVCCFIRPDQVPAMKATVYHVWWALQLPGRPGLVTFSPFAVRGLDHFIATPDGSRWYDYGLEQSGGVLEFIMRALRVDAGEARWALGKLQEDVAAGIWREVS